MRPTRSQPHAHEDVGVGLAHRPHQRHLADLGVREDVPVVADALGGLPEAVAHRQRLAVLGELHVGRERQHLGIVRDQRLQVLVDHALEARAIAVERDGSGGTAYARDQRSGHEGSRKTTATAREAGPKQTARAERI